MTDDLIDLSTFGELRETVGAEFVGELVDAFLDEAPQMLAALRSALDEKATEAFRRAAHSLKTNAHTFGATALGARAKELELGGLPGDDAVLDELDAAFADAAAVLRSLRDG